MSWKRTHHCGELRENHAGQNVVLNGWVNTIRAYPSQIFIDLRDRYGITQVVVEASQAEAFATAQQAGREFVLAIQGQVAARLPGKDNINMATGKVELKAQKITILNACPTPPLEVTEFPGDELANEDLRMQYRYLDLRRPSLQKTLAIRHRMNKTIRDFLDAEGFYELETPLLGRSTPEGAREYIVPSRIFPGEFYALPQSPQLYKQLLMVAGYDKYFQIARCLRDEELRADRQPEFTQLDLEMSFVEREDILSIIERLTVAIVKTCLGLEMKLPFPRITYAEAMLRYGSDKPDLRYGMEIVDVSSIVGQSEFKIFKECIAGGGVVRALCAKKAADRFSNTDLKPGGKLSALVGQFGAKGLASFKVEAEKLTGAIEKFFPPELQAQLRTAMKAEAGDLLLFVADKESVVCQSLGNLRTHLANELKLYQNWWEKKAAYDLAAEKDRKAGKVVAPYQVQPEDLRFAWVIDFPSFLWVEEDKRWVANHHPFTSPRDEDIGLMESDPGKVLAKAYDLVLNGYEVGGGSVRIHNPEVQAKLFSVLGVSREQAKERFGFLLDALGFGAPPHGGIALGLDRFSMMLAGSTNIRDVIAFPKNQRARDLMTGAPAAVDAGLLKELGVKVAEVKG